MSIKIAIDAGHGLYTAGKRCMKKLDSKQTREWFLNDRIADRLEALLGAYNCEVLRTDDTTGLTDVSLANRVKKANNWGADIVISIHHNAGINGGTGGGTVVCCWDDTDSKNKAKALYNAVVAQTGLKGNRAYSVSVRKDLYLIKNTKSVCLLLENGFMDSATDVPVILSDAHANKTAQGLLNYLVSQFKLTKVNTTVSNAASPVVNTSFKVKVIVNDLNYRAGAGTEHKINGVIRNKGVYTIVATAKSKDGGTWGKLKSGAGWINISSKYVSRV